MRSARTFLLTFVLSLLTSVSSFPQTPPAAQKAKTPGTVAGRVTVEGGAQAGIQVMLQPAQAEAAMLNPLNQAPPLTAATDADGNYRLISVPPGKYRLSVYAPVYVAEQNQNPFETGQSVTVEEGETLENLNFALRRGGVITGKVANAEGQPQIEEQVTLTLIDAQGKEIQRPPTLPLLTQNHTDDRGIYRVFGVEPGRYRVSAGGAGNFAFINGAGGESPRTYHPGTPNEAEARVIEVRAGLEIEAVDIVLGRAQKKGYAASGRVIEADTGKGVAGLMLMYSAKKAGLGDFGMGNATTNSQGEFRLESLAPGAYSVAVFNMQAMMTGGTELYAEPATFEISSGDIGGVEIKMRKGASISGAAVIDRDPERKQAARLNDVMVQTSSASVPGENDAGTDVSIDVAGAVAGTAMAMLKPDGTFRLGGLRPRKVSLTAQSLTERTLKLVRVEHHGVVVNEFALQASEQITGVRLVFAFGTASLSGRVEVRGGTLPPGAHISVMAQGQEEKAGMRYGQPAEVSPNGQFTIEGLLPGTYELEAHLRTATHAPIPSTTQKLTVALAENAKREVVLVVELKQKENDR